MQLRPKAEVYKHTKESRKGYDLDVSMFERVRKFKIQRRPIYQTRCKYATVNVVAPPTMSSHMPSNLCCTTVLHHTLCAYDEDDANAWVHH